MTDTNNNRDVARDVFWRYLEVYGRGHDCYIQRATRLEEYYLGGGGLPGMQGHWRHADRAAIECEGRPAREINTILPTVNAAAGYQINNRVDIAYLPRGRGADEQTAKVASKVIRHALDLTMYRYAETDVFLDGLIQQRGYLDMRMDYNTTTKGNICVTDLDPVDVLPDPDAKSYNPDGWSDVQITRFLTARDIEGIYSKEAADAVVENSKGYCDMNFGDTEIQRRGFGMPSSYANGWGWYADRAEERRYRVIDRQSHEYANTLVAMYPTGDFRNVEGYEPNKLAWLIDQGVQVLKRRIRRVRWEVCAPEVCFHNELSPYDHFTVIPYFPYFRRGKTIGMIDNMVSPSDMLNKFVSQYEHAVNTAANSGWQGEANSLSNMPDSEFIERGAENGLVLLRKPGTAPFQKIEPGQVPNGIDKMIQWSHDHLNIVSGVDKNLREPEKNDLSGVAVKALQYASQQKLAIALDNLSRTRHMVADRALGLAQRFMGDERVLRITEIDKYGVERQKELPINVRMEDGSIFNDLTIGEYDMVITEKPAAVTFDSSEFEQMKAMRGEMGIAIPDATVVRASTLSDKSDIAEAMQEQEGQVDPRIEAEAALLAAQTRKADNEAVAKSIESQYSAIQTAQAIVVTPEAAALADALLRSGGFVDKDAAPIIPEAPPGLEIPAQEGVIPQNTHPLDPANPEQGITRGLSDGPTQPVQ